MKKLGLILLSFYFLIGKGQGNSTLLGIENGGTGLSSITANRILYAPSANALGQSPNLIFNGTQLGINTTPTAVIHAVGTGTNSSTYAMKLLNNANSSLLNIRDNGFIGFHTDSLTEYATDVNDAYPTTYTYVANFNYDQPVRSMYKFGNKKGAPTVILLGDARRARYGSIQAVPPTAVVPSFLSGQVLINSGSGMTNGLAIYADNGCISLSTSPDDGTGYKALVVGPYPNSYVGIGTRKPSADLQVKKTSNPVIESWGSGGANVGIIRAAADATEGGNQKYTIQIRASGRFSKTSGAFTARHGLLYTDGTGLDICSSDTAGAINFYSGGSANSNLNLVLTNTGVLQIVKGTKIDKSINNNGSGLKHSRVITNSIPGNSYALITVNWETPFSDANYTVQAQIQDTTNSNLSLQMVHIESVSPEAVKVRVYNNSTIPLTGTVHVIAIHD